MLPKAFFVVSGTGVSGVSKLNAFDSALAEAGISQCNLVEVSSIIPTKARQVKPKKNPAGEITFCVLARCDGIEGETVSAGIAWAECDKKSGESYGIVAEASGVEKEKYVREDLKRKLGEMADSRGMTISEINYETATAKDIPEGSYGSAISALVYVF